MKTAISIAMATYNGEKHLREQLESLAKQTVLPLELVVCDDCSSDATVNIVNDFAASAPFVVRLYRNEFNLGYSDNFLKAAGLCCGQWIAFCDQDDVWLPNKLARVSEAIIARRPGDELMLVAHSSLVANEKLELMEQRSPHFSRDAYVRRADRYAISVIQGFSLVCNAILVKEVDSKWRPIIYNNDKSLHVTSPSHDGWICTLANALGDTLYLCEPLAIWRRHNQAKTFRAQRAGILSKNQIMTNHRTGYFFKDVALHVKESIAHVNPVQYSEHSRVVSEYAESSLRHRNRFVMTSFVDI